MSGRVVLFDASRKFWLEFLNPLLIVQTGEIDQVLPSLRQVEDLVEQNSWHAAGFLSYEAGPAFDRALVAHPPGSFPLLWFGLYEKPRPIHIGPSTSEKFAGVDIVWTPTIDLLGYTKAITEIKKYIADGDTYQVNYTIRLRTNASFDAWELFLRINQAQRASYGAYLDIGDYTICCASPELFFHLDGHQIKTRPMKGTAQRGLTSTQDQEQAQWLYNSQKNRAENVMIVDMLRNDLGKIARTGSVSVPSLFELERYPTVWQMTSTVLAETNAPVNKIFQALFPCGSITGAPKARTMQIIRRLEKDPRQVYTGSIGFIAPGRRAQFNVAIRTVLLDHSLGIAEYGVGGGIVWDSTPEEEYAECHTKAGVLTRQPASFSLLETLLWESGSGFFLLEYHLRRLSNSAGYFGYPYNADKVLAVLNAMAANSHEEALRLRLLLTAGGQVECQAAPLNTNRPPAVVVLRLAVEPVNSQDFTLYHKTTRRSVYDAARQSAPDAEDVVLWNEHGEVTETSTANLMYELDGRMYTPPVECGLLPGVYRAWLLDRGLVKERRLALSELKQVSKLYLVNSVRKMRPAILIPQDMPSLAQSGE